MHTRTHIHTPCLKSFRDRHHSWGEKNSQILRKASNAQGAEWPGLTVYYESSCFLHFNHRVYSWFPKQAHFILPQRFCMCSSLILESTFSPTFRFNSIFISVGKASLALGSSLHPASYLFKYSVPFL